MQWVRPMCQTLFRHFTILLHLIRTTTLWNRYYCMQFTDKETEIREVKYLAQSCTAGKSHSQNLKLKCPGSSVTCETLGRQWGHGQRGLCVSTHEMFPGSPYFSRASLRWVKVLLGGEPMTAVWSLLVGPTLCPLAARLGGIQILIQLLPTAL